MYTVYELNTKKYKYINPFHLLNIFLQDPSKPVEPYESTQVHYGGQANVQQSANQLASRTVLGNAKVPLRVNSNNYKYVPTFEIEYSYDGDDTLAPEVADDKFSISRISKFLQENRVQAEPDVPDQDLTATQNVRDFLPVNYYQSPTTAKSLFEQSFNTDSDEKITMSKKQFMRIKNVLEELKEYFTSTNSEHDLIVPTTKPQTTVVDDPLFKFSQYPVDSQSDNTKYIMLNPIQTEKTPVNKDISSILNFTRTVEKLSEINDMKSKIAMDNMFRNKPKYTETEENVTEKKSNVMFFVETPSEDALTRSTKVEEDRIGVEPSMNVELKPETRNALMDIIYISNKSPTMNKKEDKPSVADDQTNKGIVDIEFVNVPTTEKPRTATNSPFLDIILFK